MRKLYKTLRVVLSVTGILLLAACSNASDGPDDASLEVPAKETVATPAFSVASGAVNSGTSVKITCATEGAKIYYTTDGTEPTAKSREYTYAIKVTEAVTVKAVAVKSGMNDSTVATASYTIKQTVATPTFSMPAGAVPKGTSVTITCTTEGAKIYYTTDGTEPTASSTEYTAAITINRDITVKAVAVKDGMNNSAVASASYSNTVPAPTFSVPAGDVENGTSVTISCTTEGAKIYYTIDGTVPTASSTGYTGAISVTSPLTIKAIAVKEAMDDSAVASASYKIIPAGFVKVTGVQIKGTEIWDPSSYVFKSGKQFTIPTLIVCDHEVTEDEFKTVMGRRPPMPEKYNGTVPNKPVGYVNWYAAICYCNKLSIAENLKPCYSVEGITNWAKLAYNDIPDGLPDTNWNNATCDFEADGYRLPTEAEWEWLARGGENYTYAGSNTLEDVAWYKSNTNDTGAREVKTKAPNGYGLYDMSGNVKEWCWNVVAGYSDETRATRGGSWNDEDDVCMVGISDAYYLNNSWYNIGFRVVRTATKSE